MATLAAATAFRRTWSDPDGIMARQQYAAQQSIYEYRWHLYNNSIFDDAATWYAYRRRYGLYRYIRPLYNPTTRLVDFYAGIVYPGVLAVDAKNLPDGTPLAIPLADDIKPALRNAIGQLWQWSNWQTGKSLMVRYGAALGDVAVEVIDEVDRGKVTFDILWPGWVTALELDGTGNVKSYALEYDATDENGKEYTYRKEVDGARIAEYRDGELYQYDPLIDAERVNPYGFAPMVWCKHTDVGGNYGRPAIRNVNKVDELNEMASHAHDRAHAVLSSPILVAGEGVQSLDSTVTEAKRQATQDLTNPSGGRESVKILKANNGALSTVDLPEGEALNYMTKLLAEIEEDHPELTMYKQLREMSQVTGPGAERMIGDAAAYIVDARANYDMQSIKLFQMAIAIAGWRANSGAWGRTLTQQQLAFKPFDLQSYAAGELDFEIEPRPIVATSKLSADEQRALMDAGDRGYASHVWVSDQITGDGKAQMAQVEQEQAAQQSANAALVQSVADRLSAAQQQNQQSLQSVGASIANGGQQPAATSGQ